MDIDEGAGLGPDSCISVKCSWTQVKNSVEQAFSFLDFNKNQEDDTALSIGAESCVLLSQPEESDTSLTIDLTSSDPSLSFRKIHILSEANYVEVYGLFGEYMKTVVGELLEDVDGTLAFSCLVDDIKLSHLTLKLVGLKGAKEVWLFCGSVWSTRDDSQVASTSRLNMERIDSRLSDTKCQLSPSADSLKRLVTEYISRGGGPPSIQSLANLASLQDTRQIPSTSRTQPTSSTQTVDFIKTYIDSSMKNMENRLMDNVTEQIRELELRQNKRLDHILKLLENSAPVTNPNP